MAAHRVHAEDHGEARRALAPDEREPPRLGLDHAPFAPARAAAARLTPRLHLLARAPVAADTLEVAARRLVAPELGQRALEAPHLGLALPAARPPARACGSRTTCSPSRTRPCRGRARRAPRSGARGRAGAPRGGAPRRPGVPGSPTARARTRRGTRCPRARHRSRGPPRPA